ncbi:hypothetical protein AciX8_2032 [Granulicella mallensis MP5ACTX8]|uniref:Uncharacterized protein n=1 Tax=Granulicella mallensis (strain ATCC BAA-1857 / DSM 23137 / MP5ACTX8) TaxID=682795 RepID=G8NTN8_GRAMM|nr:hypothetical protein AciX8_2032 [Granulicella mallensis MP5ACTX8]
MAGMKLTVLVLSLCCITPPSLVSQEAKQPPVPEKTGRYQILNTESGQKMGYFKIVLLLDTATGITWKYEPESAYTGSDGKEHASPGGHWVRVDFLPGDSSAPAH